MNRMTALSLAVVFVVAFVSQVSQATLKAVPTRLQTLPKGWTVKESIVIPEQKLGDQVVRISNTTLAVDGQELKINIVECQTEEGAAKVRESILRAQKNNHARSPLEGKSAIELISKDLRLIERAYQELGFKRPSVTYLVSFRAAPIEKCDYMMWNKMFNAFLAPQHEESLIGELGKSFTFGNQIRLRMHGQGSAQSTFTFSPAPSSNKIEADGEIAAYSFAELPRKHGLPEVGIAATVTCEAFSLTPTKRMAGPELLDANEFWPSRDPEVIALAKTITEGKTTVRDKSEAILAWLVPSKNIKFGGPIMGSRYGVKMVLQQRFGHCWDFSDCFVTLGRAAGIPCRQVLGWLHGVSGHVWAEVLIEGEGWRQVDPTAGMGCDCRYIPYVTSEDGKMSFVYTSPVHMKWKQ